MRMVTPDLTTSLGKPREGLERASRSSFLGEFHSGPYATCFQNGEAGPVTRMTLTGLPRYFWTRGPLKVRVLLKEGTACPSHVDAQELKDELCRKVIATSKPIKEAQLANSRSRYL